MDTDTQTNISGYTDTDRRTYKMGIDLINLSSFLQDMEIRLKVRNLFKGYKLYFIRHLE